MGLIWVEVWMGRGFRGSWALLVGFLLLLVVVVGSIRGVGIVRGFLVRLYLRGNGLLGGFGLLYY